MNWKAHGRKYSCPILRHFHRICQEGLRKEHQQISTKDRRSMGQDSNLGTAEQGVGVITTLVRSAIYGIITKKYFLIYVYCSILLMCNTVIMS